MIEKHRLLASGGCRKGNRVGRLVLKPPLVPTFRRLLEVTGLDEHVTVESAAP